VIEIEYGDFPAETGWPLRDSALVLLIAGQSTGSFSTEDSAVSKTAHITEGAYTFEMTETYGDGICCQYGASEFKITGTGEPVAIISISEFRYVVRESFDVVRCSTGLTVDYRLDVAYDDYPYETSWSLQSLTTSAVVAASGFNEVTELGYLLDESDVLITSSNGVPVTSLTKSLRISCIVSRMTSASQTQHGRQSC
jgi:hypothetical protein